MWAWVGPFYPLAPVFLAVEGQVWTSGTKAPFSSSPSMTVMFLFFAFFWGPHLWHMEFPRLEVKSELQLPAYTRATAMPDPSFIEDLHHSLWQCQILNLMSKARDRTHIFMDASWVLSLLSHNGNSECHVS